jgi:uncharacterized membrane protein YhhN
MAAKKMIFIVLPLLIAGIDWLALYQKWKSVDYIAKPATMIALLGWIWLVVPQPISVNLLLWIQIALIFALIGDVFLMLPKERFLYGLVAFLLAHMAYIIGLNLDPPIASFSTILVTIGIILIGWRLFDQIRHGLIKSKNEAFLRPVIIYSLVITLMVWSAIMTFSKSSWSFSSAFLVSLGASLFYISDALLAWNRFVKPIEHGRLKVRITYHLGQVALVLGSAWPYIDI